MEENTMKIIILWESFLSIVNVSLGLHEDTTIYIENYKYTRLQGKGVGKSEYILFNIL
jgi:hypothetical protein